MTSGPGYLVVPEQEPGLFHGLLCATGFRYHIPERVNTALGSAWRCKACGKGAATAGELVDIDDQVRPPA